MLRYSYLPSDFNPMLLMLGDADDLAALAGWLRDFAETGAPADLGDAAFAAASDTGVWLETGTPATGLWLEAGGGKRLRWRLDAALAAAFAARLDAITGPGVKSGSEALVAEARGEIPVKVSHGEFTDDFLADTPG